MDNELIRLLGLPDSKSLMATFVGAGGKTTTMLALAQEYKALGKRVLVTTTTHIWTPSKGFADTVFIGKRADEVTPAISGGSITVLGKRAKEHGKLSGVSAEELNAIYQSARFDIILVEGDGARGLPIKAPADHEPVIPVDCSHVIGIIGMNAYGQPINDKWVHRTRQFLSVTDSKPEQTIDVNIILRLVGSPEGLFKSTPLNAVRILLLNQCTDVLRKNAAEALISSCMNQHIGGLSLGVQR